MPSVPSNGKVTVCEINRELVVADSLSDAVAKNTYGSILGMVFNPILFQPNVPANQEQQSFEEEPENVSRSGLASVKSIIVEHFKQMLFPGFKSNLLGEVDTQRICWNPQKLCLAFISGSSQVTVCDFEDPDSTEPCKLESEHQKDVKAVEWRPNSGKTIAVGCKGGICIWSAAYPDNPASARIPPSVITLHKYSGVRWTLIDVLQSIHAELVTTLSWRPDGRFLVSSSCDSSSFTVWDVSQGIGTPIRRGLGPISFLRWSPTGDYLLTTKFDGKFDLWETNTWTSAPWSSSTGRVTGAVWDPEGRIVLMSFSDSTTLGSIHFSSGPPSLDAHLLTVELPEISSLVGSHGIEKMAWDASGERLAVSFKDGNEMYSGLVALYDTKCSPVISASLVGFIRGPGDCADCAKPLAFAFHSKFKQGPLLSVCWSTGWCCTYPLILHARQLP